MTKWFGCMIIFLSACSAKDAPQDPLGPIAQTDFNSYWYSGKAELSHYDLKQARYGEYHEGEAIMIFVTEDFLVDKQVKYEFGDGDNTSVMKLNGIRRFKTGLYDYSLMRSVFTPVDRQAFPNTLKISHTAQDWCGHSFTQLNLSKDHYTYKQFSYFQAEADRETDLPIVLLEDELWTRIKLGHEIAQGDVLMIPGLDHVRMGHLKAEPYRASIRKDVLENGTTRISVDYEKIARALVIDYESSFPHRIVSWSEEVISGFGKSRKVLKTEAVLRRTMWEPYWQLNKNEAADMRKDFGLQW